jgi:hypothetical protein
LPGTAPVFHWLMQSMGDLKMLENTGDFRLMRVPVAGKIPM